MCSKLSNPVSRVLAGFVVVVVAMDPWSWRLVLKYFWPPSKWGKVHAPQKLVTTILWTDILHGTLSSPWPLRIVRFACYVIQRNDLQ